MKRVIGTALLMVLLAACPVLGQDQSLADDPRVQSALELLKTWLEAERTYKQIPGISVGIVYDQDLIWSGGLGYSNREQQRAATEQTIYSICSISKLFTSIGVMQLRDKGQITLRDTPGEHLPWFNVAQAYPERAAVTIRGMLTHSSGLPRESDFPYWSAPDFEFPTREQIIEQLGAQQTLYPADTYYQYSNLGLTLAGMILEEVSGQTYEDYVKANILEPLGLGDTRPELPRDLWGTRLAVGYGALSREGTRSNLPFFQANGIAPAAGYSSTVEDLATFASWQLGLLDDGTDDGVLSANTLREMQRVQFLDPDWEVARGLGFEIVRANGRTFVGHGGSCPGYQTSLRIQPDSKIATIVMANASGVAAGAYTVRAFDIVAPAIMSARESPDETMEIDPELLKYTGTYDRQPWAGEIAVLPWNGGLAMLPLPTDDPLEGLIKLEHSEENRFRRIRDDEELGEEIVFEIDQNGQVLRMRRHSNYWPRVN